MVERLAGPGAISAAALGKEVGVAQSTLSKWLRDASTVPPMANKKNERRGGAQQSPRKWSGVEKVQAVLESVGIPEGELGEFLRRKGIHECDLKTWREVALKSAAKALEGGDKMAKNAATAARRIKELEQDLAKKDRRLKAVNALLELQKKVREIWGDAEEPTHPRSEA